MVFSVLYCVEGKSKKSIPIDHGSFKEAINFLNEQYSPRYSKGLVLYECIGDSKDVLVCHDGLRFIGGVSENPISLAKLVVRDLNLPDSIFYKWGNDGAYNLNCVKSFARFLSGEEGKEYIRQVGIRRDLRSREKKVSDLELLKMMGRQVLLKKKF